MKSAFPALCLSLALAAPALSEGLLIVSDLHFTADVSAHQEVMDAIVQAAEGYDAVLILGDMANSGRPREHAVVRDFLARLEREAGAQALVLPGNHDLSGGVSPQGFADLYRDYGYDLAFSNDPSGAGYAAMTADGICLLMLDVNAYDARAKNALHGAVRVETLAWIDETLDALPEGTPAACFGHYPLLPFTGNGSDDTANAEALAKLLMDRGVPLYICGHRHGNATRRWQGLRQITVGVPFAYPAWAGVLTVTDDAFDYRALPLFPEYGETHRRLAKASLDLAQRMAEGSLKGTAYEGDMEAIGWFIRVYAASLSGTLASQQQELLAHPGHAKWQAAQVRSMAKPWILSLVQSPPEDVRHLLIPMRQ